MKQNPKNEFSPLLHLTYLLQQSTDEKLLSEVGVGLSATRIMSTLSGSAGRSQRSIAVELRQTEANISRQLQVMKRDGLVSITKSKKDNRQREVRLTTKGRAKSQLANKLLTKQELRLMKLLNKSEQKTFSHAVNNLFKTA